MLLATIQTEMCNCNALGGAATPPPPGPCARPPAATAEAVARLQDVGQKGVVRGAARLLRVVAPLRPGLLQPVAHHDGRVHDDRRRPGRPAGQLPAPPHHPLNRLAPRPRTAAVGGEFVANVISPQPGLKVLFSQGDPQR